MPITIEKLNEGVVVYETADPKNRRELPGVEESVDWGHDLFLASGPLARTASKPEYDLGVSVTFEQARALISEMGELLGNPEFEAVPVT